MGSSAGADHVSIIDIRRSELQFSLLGELLYDEQGLKLFEEITYLEEYYLTNAEIEVLEKNADEIAKWIRPGSLVVELGSGYATGHDLQTRILVVDPCVETNRTLAIFARLKSC